LAYLVVNVYEIAVLRILVKRQHPMKVSNLVNGFPDDSGANVLQAVSKLHFLGYVLVYDTPVQYISLCKDTRKEVLKIVNPNLNEESQTKQYCFNQRVSPHVSKNLDETKNNKMINLRPLVQTGTIALAAIAIGLVIATGGSLFQYYVPTANNQEPASILLLYHPSSFSATTDKFQSLYTSTPAQEAGLNSFAVGTMVSTGGGSFIDNVFVHDNNTFHRIIIEGGTEKVSDVSTTMYLKNAFVVLKI
jgi:hypothetical protein